MKSLLRQKPPATLIYAYIYSIHTYQKYLNLSGDPVPLKWDSRWLAKNLLEKLEMLHKYVTVQLWKKNFFQLLNGEVKRGLPGW